MKTRILIAIAASAVILFSFSFIGGTHKNDNKQVANGQDNAPAGGLAVEEVGR